MPCDAQLRQRRVHPCRGALGPLDRGLRSEVQGEARGQGWVRLLDHVEKCLMTRDWRSDLCFLAQEIIGFSDEDFHAKFDRYLAERDAKMPVVATPKPTSNP